MYITCKLFSALKKKQCIEAVIAISLTTSFLYHQISFSFLQYYMEYPGLSIITYSVLSYHSVCFFYHIDLCVFCICIFSVIILRDLFNVSINLLQRTLIGLVVKTLPSSEGCRFSVPGQGPDPTCLTDRKHKTEAIV